jgi:AcrR family transcriptional regulator
MATTKPEGSARERLLEAANDLFYAEGVHTVGIDRVIEHAGVAKASLYSAFGSKEELVRAYLERRAQTRQQRILERIATREGPRDRVLAVFDLLREIASEPRFRGCAFVNASAEGPRTEGRARKVCLDARSWTRRLFVDLARECGAHDPERLGRSLALLYDGALVGASMEGDPAVVGEARAVAEVLLDAQAPGPRRRSRDVAAPSRRNAKARRSGGAGGSVKTRDDR